MIASAVLCCLLLAPATTVAGGYGQVAFANSGAPAAQAAFQDGMAMLHDFEYASAAQSFRRAQATDPGCAMAYWGEAMTYNHPIWMEQDLAGGRAALGKLAPTAEERRARAGTEREKAYLDAIEILYGEGSKAERDFRYRDAMAALHERFPDDVDAAAFYGLSILGTAHAGRDIATYMRAAGVLEQAWIGHHEHPGLLHYLIHSYDDPDHAPLGLRMARIYARVAPDAAHAQHMTSHIFLALGMWPETVQANLAAIADVNRVRRAEGRGPRACGHYPSWLGYAYLQLGQTDKARQALEDCRASLTSDLDPAGAEPPLDPDGSRIGSFANMRLRYLIDTGTWTGDVVDWPLPAAAGLGARLDFAVVRAFGAIARGATEEARRALEELERVGREVEELEVARGDAYPSYRVRPSIFVLEARGLLAESEGDLSAAERHLRDAVTLEESLPVDFGPPTIDKPTRELLGEFFLRHARKQEAATEFTKAATRTPGRRLVKAGLRAAPPAPPFDDGGGGPHGCEVTGP